MKWMNLLKNSSPDKPRRSERNKKKVSYCTEDDEIDEDHSVDESVQSNIVKPDFWKYVERFQKRVLKLFGVQISVNVDGGDSDDGDDDGDEAIKAFYEDQLPEAPKDDLNVIHNELSERLDKLTISV
jgi:hypothetical protein